MRSKNRRLIYLRDVLRVLVARDFKVRYKRSVLGIAWSLLVPLAQLAVFYVVFSKMIKLQIPHYTSFLLAGILPWTWFQTSVLSSTSTLLENREMIQQAGFPIGLLPTVTVTSHLVHFLLALPLLMAFIFADGLRLGMSVLLLPAVVLVQFLMTLSIAYFTATLQVKFRDTQYLLGIALFLLFYLTPIFWDPQMIGEPYRRVFLMNPVAGILAAYRDIFIRAQWPQPGSLLLTGCVSAIVLWVGYVVFNRARLRFVEEI